MKVSELKRLLQKKGCKWYKDGSKHEQWINPATNQKASIPRHNSKELPTGTVTRILSDLGIK